MFPIILERDATLVSIPVKEFWCETLSNPRLGTAEVRSDGVLYPDYGQLIVSESMGVVTTRNATCAGLHMGAPEPGGDYTPYAVHCVAMSEDLNVRPYLFMGQGPSSVTDISTGNQVSVVSYLAFGPTPGTEGSNMSFDAIVNVVEMNIPTRPVTFAVGMLAGATAGTDGPAGFVRMTVRRLIAPGPRVIDTRKQ